MKNTLLIILGLIAFGVGSFFVSRMFIAPRFQVYSYTPSTKSGTFTFGKADNNFGPGQSGTVGGRNGYSLQYGPNAEGVTKFVLWKDGKMIKELVNTLA